MADSVTVCMRAFPSRSDTKSCDSSGTGLDAKPLREKRTRAEAMTGSVGFELSTMTKRAGQI